MQYSDDFVKILKIVETLEKDEMYGIFGFKGLSKMLGVC